MQDWSFEQEMRLIRQATCLVVMVGDFNETINDFRHTVEKSACDQKEYCILPTVTEHSSLVVEWSKTFRLDKLSVQWIENMHAYASFILRLSYIAINNLLPLNSFRSYLTRSIIKQCLFISRLPKFPSNIIESTLYH